ncbi:STAS domain-containing protein [Actinoplanes sp. KI2]|uniref:STAS domain-containing protein n=1 Tax=Actinoplanes sp. KI2 TaxID=2983315 RepID=UPI0021D5FB1C|nr:STAS domain-containing protein [Actinoplanes sp. KI2]MCU7730953.1 STAS domain-containing protein [Actinoplanes sp. KI2]
MRPIAIKRTVVNDGVVRLAVSGDVDIDSCDVLATMIRYAVTVERVAELVVDLERVSYLDSGAIRALVEGHHLATEHGVAYQVINPDGSAHRAQDVRTGLQPFTEPR